MRAEPNPQPGEFWATPKGRTVEIVAREVVEVVYGVEAVVIAYRFLGGSTIHLRHVNSLTAWSKAIFE